MKTPEEIAQWVINNRYPQNEKQKVSDAEMYNNLVDSIANLCNLPVVMPRILHFVDENGNNVDLNAAGVNAKLLRDGTFEYFISYGFAGRKELTPVYGA